MGTSPETQYFRDIGATVVAPTTHSSIKLTEMAVNSAFQPCPKAADSGIKG
jgi:hypothetical protein